MLLRILALLFLSTAGQPLTAELVGGSEIQEYSENCTPRHVHTALGNDPSTSVTVSFSSSFHPKCRRYTAAVFVGKHASNLDSLVFGNSEPRQYNRTFIQWKHKAAVGEEEYKSDLIHHIKLTGLLPNTKYFFRCALLQKEVSIPTDMNKADMASGFQHDRFDSVSRLLRKTATFPQGPSSVLFFDEALSSFKTGPVPGSGLGSIKFVIIGDIGQTDIAESTAQIIADESDIDSIFLAGDIAYADAKHHLWDSWFDKMKDLLRTSTLHTAPGNHDIQVEARSRQIFAAYNNRFAMPSSRDAVIEPSPRESAGSSCKNLFYPLVSEYGNFYYAFTYGAARAIFLNSFAASSPGSSQYNWLVNELNSIDRQVTPWVFVTFHCPFYNTYKQHQDEEPSRKMMKYLEPLFVEHRVNMIFNGHTHAYMRTKNVAFGEVNKIGPQYVILGDSGQRSHPTFVSDVPEKWVEARDGETHGYGTVAILNKTHAQWEWIHTGPSAEGNFVDKSLIVNQFFS
mmetsp:Transcript_12092/g.16712  ORF Transcript_12092/g.16712 Transcript_12092/m.16712 type:complete len:511 (-) Transcript_12092:439-1971(-)